MQTDILAAATGALLTPNDLAPEDLRRAIGRAMAPDTDLADVFLEAGVNESWELSEGRVSGGSYAIGGGLGLRTVIDDRTAFAYSGDISASALDSAVAAVTGGRDGTVQIAAPKPFVTPPLYTGENPILGWSAERKTTLLHLADSIARAADPRVIRVSANIFGHHQTVMVMREDGGLAADLRPLVRFQAQVVVEGNGRRESGYYGIGGRHGLDAFDEAAIRSCVLRAVEIATVNLDARPAPAGAMSVILGPGYPGVLFHEAIGHGLEGDFNRRRSSAFSGRLGERVAAPGVTVIDDGSLAHRRGSLTVDDEGNATEPTVLIEDGILRGYMQDRLNARLMNMRPTGNGRRQSYAHLPMPRMTNTFLAGGDFEPDEIIRSVKRGIYAAEFGGGQVDIVSGQFNFSTTLAYLIEDGRITAPIQGATLIGSGPTSLLKIAMVGRDFALDEGTAVCGKAGQTLPVTVGQPTLRIDDMVVGGSA